MIGRKLDTIPGLALTSFFSLLLGMSIVHPCTISKLCFCPENRTGSTWHPSVKYGRPNAAYLDEGTELARGCLNTNKH